MGEKHEFKVGDTVLLKVGRNKVQVKILKPMAGGNAFMVKSLASGKDFIMPSSRLNVSTVSIESIETKQKVPSPAPAETEDASTPAPESKPVKKMSLMDAAVAVLKESGKSMNTREMVKAAAEKGYWSPTACRTPEQILYGSIFREIKTKEQPRFRKSATRKGSFEYAKEQ